MIDHYIESGSGKALRNRETIDDLGLLSGAHPGFRTPHIASHVRGAGGKYSQISASRDVYRSSGLDFMPGLATLCFSPNNLRQPREG
jgi:hypothetical protein